MSKETSKLSTFLDWLAATKKRQTVVLVVAVVAVILALALVVYMSSADAFKAESNVSALGLKDIGELATQSGFFTEVNVIDDAKKFYDWNIPFTSSKYVFSYDGVIKAGIDFSEIELSVSEEDKTVNIKMPESKFLSRELKEDSLEIYDERQSVFTPLTLTDIQESRMEMLEELEQTAQANGLLDQANENAKVLVTGFLAALYNPAEYTYVFE